MIKTILKNIRKWVLWILTISIVFVIGSNLYVNRIAEPWITSEALELPKVKYGLLLGTSKYFKKGENNDFYVKRLNAAIKLYSLGKIEKIIISGTHEESNYSEPLSIQKDLMQKGIPDTAIILDYYGDRTLLSILNFKNSYRNDSVIVITQKFHNQRAIFLGRKNTINIWGYNAEDVKIKTSFKVLIREYFAKAKAVLE